MAPTSWTTFRERMLRYARTRRQPRPLRRKPDHNVLHGGIITRSKRPEIDVVMNKKQSTLKEKYLLDVALEERAILFLHIAEPYSKIFQR